MLTIPQLCGGAIIGILGGSTITNVIETISICSSHDRSGDTYGSCDAGGSKLLNEYVQESSSNIGLTASAPDKSTEQVISDLKKMKRKDLISLFLHLPAPAILADNNTGKGISGEFDGILLDNGIIMTSVANFITNVLFSMGRKWNGKSFSLAQNNSKKGVFKGINRFQKVSMESINTELEHQFDYSVAKSKLGDISGDSMRLIYADYQQPFSLWKSMEDELRLLRSDDGSEILLGMGSMAWSGGFMNCQPFCLVKAKM